MHEAAVAVTSVIMNEATHKIFCELNTIGQLRRKDRLDTSGEKLEVQRPSMLTSFVRTFIWPQDRDATVAKVRAVVDSALRLANEYKALDVPWSLRGRYPEELVARDTMLRRLDLAMRNAAEGLRNLSSTYGGTSSGVEVEQFSVMLMTKCSEIETCLATMAMPTHPATHFAHPAANTVAPLAVSPARMSAGKYISSTPLAIASGRNASNAPDADRYLGRGTDKAGSSFGAAGLVRLSLSRNMDTECGQVGSRVGSCIGRGRIGSNVGAAGLAGSSPGRSVSFPSSGNAGSGHAGAGHAGAGHAGAGHAGAGHAGAGHAGAGHVGAGHNGAGHAGAGHNGAGHAGAGHAGAGHAGAGYAGAGYAGAGYAHHGNVSAKRPAGVSGVPGEPSAAACDDEMGDTNAERRVRMQQCACDEGTGDHGAGDHGACTRKKTTLSAPGSTARADHCNKPCDDQAGSRQSTGAGAGAEVAWTESPCSASSSYTSTFSSSTGETDIDDACPASLVPTELPPITPASVSYSQSSVFANTATKASRPPLLPLHQMQHLQTLPYASGVAVNIATPRGPRHHDCDPDGYDEAVAGDRYDGEGKDNESDDAYYDTQ